jgi:hypothetical protein
LGQETRAMDIRPVEVCPFGLESKLEMFGFNRSVFVRRGVGEWITSACVFPTVKYGGVMVWGCCAGDTVSDLFQIQGTLNQHGYHSILQRYTRCSKTFDP